MGTYFRRSIFTRVFKRNTYDQFYNEHIYVFSTIALKRF